MMAEESSSNQTSINITEVASSIQKSLRQKSPIPSKCSIFRVPDLLRGHNQKAFDPVLVSIGPFHHGKEKFQPMQNIKLWYLDCLLNRAPTRKTCLMCFVEAISRIEKECRACYDGEIDFGEKEFIEMMVLDGCFIIEFFRKISKGEERDNGDHAFDMPWMNWQLLNDLSLLENQLPWLALDCLFNLTKSQTEQSSLPNLVLKAFPLERSTHDNLKPKHILDLLRKSLIGTYTGKRVGTTASSNPRQIPSVIELVQAGVKFKVGNKNKSLLDITFNNGVMTIPKRFVSEQSEYFFRNLIAFEQCDRSFDYKMASYAKLLDDLINTSQDVDFLKNKGILDLYLSAEEAANFFNRLYRDNVVGANFLYSKLYDDVNAYCSRRRNKWRASLKRNYFHNPWTSLSVLAAIVILVLTFLQTFYSMVAYYHTS